MKICTKCLVDQPLNHYYKDRSSKSGLKTRCKACTKEDNSTPRTKQLRQITNKRWIEANRHKRQKYRREQHLSNTYDLSIQEYETLRINQNGNCASCKLPPSNTLHVDHCHKTGKIRGLLCGNCNRALGILHEDAELILNLHKYLTESKSLYKENNHEN